jgi:hypothetical protein
MRALRCCLIPCALGQDFMRRRRYRIFRRILVDFAITFGELINLSPRPIHKPP